MLPLADGAVAAVAGLEIDWCRWASGGVGMVDAAAHFGRSESYVEESYDFWTLCCLIMEM